MQMKRNNSLLGELNMQRVTMGGALVLTMLMGCETADMTNTSKEVPSDPAVGADALGEVHVEVTYRERMLLPPTASLIVTLEDGAKMDVAAEKIAEVTLPTKQAPPYRVTLRYDSSKLQDRGRYGVRARIENDGRLMFTSTQFNPAFGADGSHDSPPHDPVQVLVSRIAGRGETRAPSITGTRWVLQKLRGEPAGSGAGGQAPHITLQGAEPRVSGFAGCNQISGGYTLDGDQLSFGQMAMTMRACPEGMDLERDFAKALEETQRYEVLDDVLRLRDEHGTVVAELRAGSS
jgi:putative lipoprotein